MTEIECHGAGSSATYVVLGKHSQPPTPDRLRDISLYFEKGDLLRVTEAHLKRLVEIILFDGV